MRAGLDSIPGYASAVKAEARIRERAWCGLGADIAGLPVEPLTLRRYLTLSIVGNPLAVGGREPTLADLVQFLWIVSPDYRVGDQKAFESFGRRAVKLELAAVIAEVEEYLADAFFDANAASGPVKLTPAWGWPAGWVDLFGREYGWPPDVVLDSPIASLFQLERLVVKRNKPDEVFVNKLSDAKRKKWLEEQNAPADPARN